MMLQIRLGGSAGCDAKSCENRAGQFAASGAVGLTGGSLPVRLHPQLKEASMTFLRSIIHFLADSLEALVRDDRDVRARKEADDKQKRWLHYLGSG